MKIPVKFLNFNKESPDKGYWDMYMLEKIFERPEFQIVDEPELDMIVVIPARHNYGFIKEINDYLMALNSVLLIIAGDEESLFAIEQLQHPNMKIWLMTPHSGKEYPMVDKFIGEFITPHTRFLPKKAPTKEIRWFFAGQVTHNRRIKAVHALKQLNEGEEKFHGELIETEGFTQGIAPKDYIKKMAHARIIPCPGGPATPDTFRFYEALEAGCIPIVDELSTTNKRPGYWKMLFGDTFPFPTYITWQELAEKINYFSDTFTENSNKIFAWWQMYKRNLVIDMIKDFALVSGKVMGKSGITAVIPTSPSKLHPDTSIIEETIQSIRSHLPDAEILITFDGIREEQLELKDQYEEYKRQLLWKINRKYKNIYPIVFEKHLHQVGMMRETMKHILTDKILYVEHDTPLTPDEYIDWASCCNMLDSQTADLIRFHFEAEIPEPHKYLMLDQEPQHLFGQPFIRTVQWSQRPHLTTKAFYERILRDHFSPYANSFIEDWMHSVVITAYKMQQVQGWNNYRLWIYAPAGNMKRSYHLDSRAGESKYEQTF